MQDNAGTSDSAASSGGSSLQPASSGDDSHVIGGEALRVDFYVLEEASSAGRLKLACRLAEKAYLAAQVALVWHTDPRELKEFDELLWTFMDGSFVPHEMIAPGASIEDTPVLLSSGTLPPRTVDIIINLAPEVPACLGQTRRVAEIIDGDDSRRRAGRARFKAYRDLGIQPASHNVNG
ncbi:MAG TPA: DNA polymerase III subunit chi [Steroidobacteraceae bacterium]